MFQRYILPIVLLFSSFHAFAQSVEFVRNEGQWQGAFAYRAATGQGVLYLSHDTFTYVLSHPDNNELIEKVHHGALAEHGPVKLNFHAYRMIFEGAKTPEITGSKAQSWYYNYFLGNDPKKWRSGIHPNLSLDYNGLYTGIDMHVFSDRNNLKYEFKVAPGADPKQIRLRFEGTDKLQLKDGNLLIHTSAGDVRELKPYTYQYIDGKEKVIGCRYRLNGNTLSYELDDYDPAKLLIIDPTVVFATFSGSTADNWGFTATYDAQGNFYAGGFANPLAYGGTFPTTPGAFQSTFGGGFTDLTNNNPDHGSAYASDITIMKLNATGTAKIYATYIGGNDNDQPHSMIVDGNNNLVIAGRTYSSDFPRTNTAYDTSYNGKADIVVIKLNPTGTALIGSTFVGGSGEDGTNFDGREPVFGNLKHNYGDDARSEVLVDNQNNVYVTSCTKSTNFPVTAGAYQTTSGGAQDGVVFKLNNDLSSLTWSTYIGGTADDAGYVLALDRTQTSLYVAGGTQSSNFPALTGGWRAAYQGSTDGYILKFTNSGSYPLVNSTFIGTSSYDQCYGLQVDLDNNVYAMGQTLGGTFPVTPGVYSNAGSSQFVIKLNPTLTTNIYSTVFGNGNSTVTNMSPVAFLVDTCQNVYISGWTGNLGFPYPGVAPLTTGMPLSTAPNPPAQSTTDGQDFYFFVLSKNAQSLLYASYMGGTSTVGEHVDGGTSRFDKDGVVYQAICGGCGGSSNFPTTPGSWSVTNASPNCNLIAVKIAFNLGAVDAGAQAAPTTRGCPPLTVQFSNNSTNATAYLWDFRDNTATSTLATPQHTFTMPGVYNVRLVANNPNACRTSDTTYVTITVDNNQVNSDFSYIVLDSCGPYRASFTNTSTYGSTPGAQSFTTFTWLFGDNTSFTGANPPIHSYAGPGTYTVQLIMRDTTACNSPDTTTKTITINSLNVRAGFNVQDSLCIGSVNAFTDGSTNATTIRWNFGDGNSDTTRNPTHTFSTAGTYTVTLIASNPNACNKVDSIRRTITVNGRPHADFTYSPVIPVPNTPVAFSNASTGATSYRWAFGDGNTSTDTDPSHLYRRTGTYTVCLVAKNNAGCTDTACKSVDADVQTGIELPTAFSPNGDGNNDRFFPRGGGIETMDFKIFNRWGQLVFEAINAPANDPAYGWDGTFKGKDQEMEVYAFVLNVTFIDGTTAQRKGNVTLIR